MPTQAKSLTFIPLSRNRYRVRGTGREKEPIVKKAQVDRTRRMFQNAHLNSGPPRPVGPSAALKTVHALWPGYGECPYCMAAQHFKSSGEKTCTGCKRRFKLSIAMA